MQDEGSPRPGRRCRSFCADCLWSSFVRSSRPGLALVVSLLQSEEYTAEASLLFRDSGFDQRLFGGEAQALIARS